MTYIIVGAGIAGLRTAEALLETYPEAKIKIIAATLPSDGSPPVDYASSWALGNQWSAENNQYSIETIRHVKSQIAMIRLCRLML